MLRPRVQGNPGDRRPPISGVYFRNAARAMAVCVALFVTCMAGLTTAADAPPGTDIREFAIDPAAVVRNGPAWKHPQAGWIVLHIEGGAYERGYQHGSLLSAEIVDYINAIASIRGAKAPADAWRDLRLLTRALFLKRFDPELLEEMKGIADGAAAAGAKFDHRRIDLVDIVTINSDIEIGLLEPALDATATGLEGRRFDTPQYALRPSRTREHCSAFIATGPATADGRIVHGHITMGGLDYARHFPVWLDLKPSRGHRIVFQTYPGGIQSGLDYYINDAGLTVSETTIDQTRFHPEGEPLASRIRRAMQYGDSIDSIVAILDRNGNGLYTNQWLLGDIKTNEIAMFELGTKRSKLWRGSRHEWHAGTTGFYFGCNNSRNLDVLKETVGDLGDKPANLVRPPNMRDQTWLQLFQRHRGTLGERFGFEAFSTPPIAGAHSHDAKVTTAEMIAKLQSWGLFGPPLGGTWEPTLEERRKYPSIRALVPNDWTLLRVTDPPQGGDSPLPADLAPFPDEAEDPSVKFRDRHPFAWRGTLLPRSDADVWLAAGFAEFEQIVAFENACRAEDRKHNLTVAQNDLVESALFWHRSRWQAAARRAGGDIPLARTRADPAHREWYEIAAGKGVLLLAALREKLGAAVAEKLFDQFGVANAGMLVSTEQFVSHCEKTAGRDAADLVRNWVGEAPPIAPSNDNIWSIYSFESEPNNALIVYGTTQDRVANRETAELLQRALARRGSNVTVPIAADDDVGERILGERHLLLVGRPAANRVTARCAGRSAVKFGLQSFTVRGETFAHPETAVIVAGPHPLTSRFGTVIFAGLSAESTRAIIRKIDPEDDDPPPQVLLAPANRPVRRFAVTTDVHPSPRR
jgi:Phospholipase B